MDEWLDRRFTGPVQWLAIIGIGAGVGFLGGMFGKGGSAIATPLLAAVGVPPIVAVASPLPATIPGTLVAYRRYRRLGLGDPDVIRTSIIVGVPATIVGALATRWIGGDVLVTVTEAVVMLHRAQAAAAAGADRGRPRRRRRTARARTDRRRRHRRPARRPAGQRRRLPARAALPGRPASCRSRPPSPARWRSPAVLALPGTIVHAALGHIDWTVTVVFAAASIPLSSYGARVALRMRADRLERLYGGGLAVLGFVLLAGSLT